VTIVIGTHLFTEHNLNQGNITFITGKLRMDNPSPFFGDWNSAPKGNAPQLDGTIDSSGEEAISVVVAVASGSAAEGGRKPSSSEQESRGKNIAGHFSSTFPFVARTRAKEFSLLSLAWSSMVSGRRVVGDRRTVRD
jgi:hypothetical protein